LATQTNATCSTASASSQNLSQQRATGSTRIRTVTGAVITPRLLSQVSPRENYPELTVRITSKPPRCDSTPGHVRPIAAVRRCHKIGPCQASAVAQNDRQRQQRAMPSGKIVPRSSWSAGTASRRPRSRRAYGRGSTARAALRRRPPSRRLCLPTIPTRLSCGCAKRSRDAMGATPHWRRGHLARLQAVFQTSAAERDRCAAIVERWNAAPTHDWSPAIGTALKADYRWLDVFCHDFFSISRRRPG
jgi:hypothetical protein